MTKFCRLFTVERISRFVTIENHERILFGLDKKMRGWNDDWKIIFIGNDGRIR